MAGRKTRLQVSQPHWSDVRGLLHLRLKDAAAALDTTPTYIRHLCRQNGFHHWPGKKIRYMNATGKKFTLAEIAETKKMGDDDMIRIHAPVVTNHPPGELTTLNLIDVQGWIAIRQRVIQLAWR